MKGCGEILVVDDVVAIVEELVSLLELHGVGAHGATTVAEAIEVLHRVPRIVAVASDVRLRHESGFDIVPRVHADAALHLRDIRFLFMSGDPMQARQSPAVSGHHVLTKPVSPGTLIEAVREMLVQASARTERSDP